MSPLIPGNIGGIWENYAQGYQGWLEKSQELVYQTSEWFEDPINSAGLNLTGEFPAITEKIYRLDESLEPVTNYSTALYAPVWQISPAPFEPSLVNYDLLSNPTFEQMFNLLIAGQAGLSAFFDPSFTDVIYEGIYTEEAHAATHDRVQGGEEGLRFRPSEQPHTVVLAPIRRDFGPDGGLVGLLSAVISSDKFLSGQLPEGVNGVYVVITNTCDQAFTYMVNGPVAIYLGPGDLHQTEYDYLEETIDLADIRSSEAAGSCGMCIVGLVSTALRREYEIMCINSLILRILLPQTLYSSFTLPRRTGQCSIPPDPKCSRLSSPAFSLQLARFSSSTCSSSSGGRTRLSLLRFAQTPSFRRCSLPTCVTASCKMPKSRSSAK